MRGERRGRERECMYIPTECDNAISHTDNTILQYEVYVNFSHIALRQNQVTDL